MNMRTLPEDGRPLRQVESLPGQRLLFGPPEEEQRDPPPITPEGERFLFDAGHGLPGASETAQRILWDVD
jgi:hypothetical protein